MVDLLPFKSGLDAARRNMPETCHDPRGAFADRLASLGFAAPKALVVGRIDRIDGPEDKPGAKSGWYIYNEIPCDDGVIGFASFGCWKSGLSDSWSSRSVHKMTTAEALAFHAAREAMKAAQSAEEKQRQEDAAARAYDIWSQAQDAAGHAYLESKGVGTSNGLKIASDGRLIIPVAFDSQIVSLQFIDNIGKKRFLSGGRTKGAWFKIEGDPATVYIAEGYATGKSIAIATGATVYIAFSSHNLHETTAYVRSAHPQARIVVAGDNGNGSRQAEQAAEGNSCEVVFPQGFKDFNDQHAAQGISTLQRLLCNVAKKIKDVNPVDTEKKEIPQPPGILGDIIAYYHATSGNRQDGFAVQTALSVASIVLGRSYKTDFENYASLYLLNVAKSSTGKEHAKTVVEKILYAANMGYLIAGDGYTSAGAVFSALLDRPRHISVIDEFGRYLEAGRDLGKGNHHQREANTKLMESIGRGHSVIRPPTYSTMTLKKDAADAVKNRQVFNPAITLLTMTTPDTLFKTLDMGAIRDGFVNRFIISISDAERAVRRHKPPVDVPQRIIDWIVAVTDRHGKPHIASEPSASVMLAFSNEALAAQEEFQQYCINQANTLERFGMAELPGRSNEMAMRIALICALARNPQAETIEISDIEWGISYIKLCLEKTIQCLKISISGSDFEAAKKEILTSLRAKGADGMTWADMQKNSPYSKHKVKDLREILSALKDADLAGDEAFVNPRGGRPTVRWTAL